MLDPCLFNILANGRLLHVFLLSYENLGSGWGMFITKMNSRSIYAYGKLI